MTLRERLGGQPFQGYAYSYPHKMAYRPLSPELPLSSLWAGEDRSALFLYVHLPFCEMRCGFCNLFTTTNPDGNLVAGYLNALERQAELMGGILKPHHFARCAIGGGTPTFLSGNEMKRLFDIIDKHLGGLAPGTPLSFEMSPGTVTPEKMKLLISRGVTRASIGVQSFVEEETRALGRPQGIADVRQALETMCRAGFEVLNIDLIYGAQNQTRQSWKLSLCEAVQFEPGEIYLYPLYVRPLTGLGKLHREPSDLRLELYRQGREFLLERGYEQISMRLFRRSGILKDPVEGPVYCCQEDGMVGLGAGARSYTDSVHYSSEYAVGRNGILEIIRDYVDRFSSDTIPANADYGCLLDAAERRRRFIIKSLLRREGLDFPAYRKRFGSEPGADFPQLDELVEHDLAFETDNRMTLTPTGMERSDTIGPWLFSNDMLSLMEEYELV